MSDENQNVKKEINNLFKDIQKYIGTNFNLAKISASEWIIKFLYPLISFLIMIVLVALFLMFISFSGAFYLSNVLNSKTLGFAIISLVYLVLIVIFLIFKKRIVIKPLAKFIINMFFHKK